MRRPHAGHHRRPGRRQAGCWRGRLYIGTAKHPDLPGQRGRVCADRVLLVARLLSCGGCLLPARFMCSVDSVRVPWRAGEVRLRSTSLVGERGCSFGATPGVRAGCCAPAPGVVAGPGAGVLAADAARFGRQERSGNGGGAVLSGCTPRLAPVVVVHPMGEARPRILEHLLLCASVPPRWTGTGSVMARVRGALAAQERVCEVHWGADLLPGGGKDPLLESLWIMSAPVGRYRRTRHHAWGFQTKNVRDTRRRGIPCPAPGRQPSPQPGAAPVPARGWGAQARQWLGSGCLDGDGVLGVRVAVHVRRPGDGEPL